MKKTTLLTLSCMLALAVLGQTPQALSYQAVARNSTGQIIPSQPVGIRFSVIEGSVNGNVIYQETHSTTTNNFGLFTLSIGGGTPGTGSFNAIDWSTGSKFLKVEIAPQGGTNYTIQGTTQFLSVPYALYSEKTKLLAGNNTISITNGNTITGNYQAANNTVLVSGNTIAGNYQPANNTVLVNGNTIAGNYQAANNTVLVNGNTIAGNYQPANNTVLVNGNTIAGNYQAANNTVLVNGNTIAGNYQPANNTVLVNGNTIAGNYQAGTGIGISGNTISHNLQAGTGISIVGNTISSTGGGNNLWIPDASGIHNQSGTVGIGTNSSSNLGLDILQPPPAGGSAALQLKSSTDTWHTALTMLNSTISANNRYSFSLGGSGNTEVGPSNFGIINHNTLRWAFNINGNTNNVGIGMNNVVNVEPARSRLHIFSGDVNIEQIGSGIILKSPNGQCWRVTIDNTGNLVRTAIACP